MYLEERVGKIDGGLAQLGERLPCKQEVSGSIPLISTKRRVAADNSLPTGHIVERLLLGSRDC